MAMEINGLNSSQTNANKTRNGQNVAATRSDAVADKAAAAKTGSDTVQISTQGQFLNRVQSQIGKESPVNREKVEAIKTALANGSYKVNADAIAKRMLDSDQLF